MNRPMAIYFLAVLIGVSIAAPPLACAQQNDVFSDVDLPDLIDDEDDGGSTPEELPIGQVLPADPFKDGQEQAVPEILTAPEFNEPTLSEPPQLDPALIDADPAPAAEDIGVGQPDEIPYETIQERDAEGRILVERGVTQDENENYVNQGPWKQWDTDGNLIVEGYYRLGERAGEWSRWYQPGEASVFAAPPFSMFTPPFLSKAAFRHGKLEGRWTISDRHDRTICDWQFSEGRRDGKSTWWYPNETRMRELSYDYGQIDGELIEWDNNGDVRTRVEYQDGRRWEKTTKLYKDGQKQVEGMVLRARLVLKDPDDWWNAKLATYQREGKDQKHGAWTAWYPNGQMRFSGEYEYDRPTGEFSWWYTNGQKSLQGSYRAGEKTGKWIWWHEVGLKSIEGAYEAGSPVERWIWWDENGRVAQRVDFSEGQTLMTQPQASRNNRQLPHPRSIMVRRKPN